MYHLAKDRDLQSKAREEVLAVLAGRPEPTFRDLSKLPFLSACIKEALRINSPISLLPARWTVEHVNLGKYHIPAGTSVVPNISAVHQNDANWPDAARFDPYRFINTHPKSNVNIPFGTGPRQCVARQFSLFEVRARSMYRFQILICFQQRTLLCMLLLHYEWSLPPGSIHESQVKNEFGAFGLSIPHDLDIEFVRRKGE